MRKLIDEFIELIIKKINEYYLCYYEEAPNNTAFPYLVMPTLNLIPLNSGYSGVFDLEIYVNELSKISVEQVIDTLRDELDGYIFRNKNIGFHIGFDDHLITKSNEQDLVIRKITFSARIFR